MLNAQSLWSLGVILMVKVLPHMLFGIKDLGAKSVDDNDYQLRIDQVVKL
jgi:hypothetical protein